MADDLHDKWKVVQVVEGRNRCDVTDVAGPFESRGEAVAMRDSFRSQRTIQSAAEEAYFGPASEDYYEIPADMTYDEYVAALIEKES